LEECGPCPILASYTLAFALQPRKKHGKTSVRVAEGKNILLTIKGRKSNWTDDILPSTCFLKRVIEGKIEGSIRVRAR